LGLGGLKAGVVGIYTRNERKKAERVAQPCVIFYL
tara:strand:+ start:14758 stop:14862 length:105 start_codon:yes stop_codon:yes gene_type:complete